MSSISLLCVLSLCCIFKGVSTPKMHHLAINWYVNICNLGSGSCTRMCRQDLSLNPICKGNIYILIQRFFDFEGQGVKKVIFHHKPTFLEQATLAQLGWQAVQAIPL